MYFIINFGFHIIKVYRVDYKDFSAIFVYIILCTHQTWPSIYIFYINSGTSFPPSHFKSVRTKTKTRRRTPHHSYKTRRTFCITSIPLRKSTPNNIIILPENHEILLPLVNFFSIPSLLILVVTTMMADLALDSINTATGLFLQPQLQQQRLLRVRDSGNYLKIKRKKKSTAATVTTKNTVTMPAVIICKVFCPTDQPYWRNDACDVEALGDWKCVYSSICFLECGDGNS